MDEVYEVIGINDNGDETVDVSVLNEETGHVISFPVSKDDHTKYKLGSTWRVRVTRSVKG